MATAAPSRPRRRDIPPSVRGHPLADPLPRFGLIPDESSEKVLARFQNFLPFMEKELDMKVETTVGTDYSATIEAMKAKKIRMDKAGVIKKDDLVVLVKSDPIPDGPVAIRKEFDPAGRAKIVAMFEKMPASVIKEAHGGEGPDRFVKGDDKIYDGPREVVKVLRLDVPTLT